MDSNFCQRKFRLYKQVDIKKYWNY